MNKHHWIIDEERSSGGEEYVRYTKVESIPSAQSSRTLADELDGLTVGRAVKFLRGQYRAVTSFQSGIIICRGEKL